MNIFPYTPTCAFSVHHGGSHKRFHVHTHESSPLSVSLDLVLWMEECGLTHSVSRKRSVLALT